MMMKMMMLLFGVNFARFNCLLSGFKEGKNIRGVEERGTINK